MLLLAAILAGDGTARAQTTQPKGTVEVGFKSSLTFAPPGFRQVLLNVVAVRINPSVNAAGTDNRWQTIPVPPGIGQSPITNSGDLQIDLNTIQDIPVFYNSALVRQNTYNIAELDLDPNNPGSVITNCPQAPSPLEGCIKYPIRLANSGNPINTGSTQLGISVKQGLVAPLYLQIGVSVTALPTAPSGAYTVAVSLNQAPTANFVGTISGTVKGGTTTTVRRVRGLSVTAETAGTNTIVASVPVAANGSYNLQLPAGPATNNPQGFGPLYDVYVSGGNAAYEAARMPPLTAGLAESLNFTVPSAQTTGTVSGRVVDACTGRPIVGATAKLLIPPGPLNTVPTIDCSLPATVGQCVVVASGSTDDFGHFPLPGTVTVPAPLANVPKPQPNFPYTLMITAAGYDPTIFTGVLPGTATFGGNCGTSAKPAPCSFSMTTGYIPLSVSAAGPASGQPIMVQVFAEDQGTNHIESALPSPIILRAASGYTSPTNSPPMLNVPTTLSGLAGLDLFATTIDSYQGNSDPYPGHAFEVIPAVTPLPEPCKMTPTQTFGEFMCAGHGTIISNTANPDLGTSVVLAKDNVQLMQTAIQGVTTPSTNYSFCAPADTYTLQSFELPPPVSGATPIDTPTPMPLATASVTIPAPPFLPTPMPPTPTAPATPVPTPTAVKSPCPTICTAPNGSCPSICNSVSPGPF